MQDILESALDDAGFLELRFHERRSLSVRVEDGRVEAATSGLRAGVGVRALWDGAWGFASTTELTRAGIRKAVEQARAAAKSASVRRKARVEQIARGALARGTFETAARDPLKGHSVEEKVALALRCCQVAQKAHPHIKSADSRYTELIDEKIIVTSDGVRARILDVKPELRIEAVAGFEGELQSAMEAVGKTGGLGDLFADGTPEQLAEKAAQTAVDLLRAGHPEPGRKQVVLAPDVVGLLIHEAIGHTVEADFVLSGSAAAGKLGQQVASPLVTIGDTGESLWEAGAGGTIPVDDEGVTAGRADIIKDGVLTGYLHNRETAARFGVEPTGNARAFNYNDVPLIRMRNTFLAPGQTALGEMLAGVDDGYMLVGAKNGQADANAEFMFAVQEVYSIKRGKLGPLLRGCTMTGNAFDVLRSVDAVGDAFAWRLGSGYCGKGQPAKVDAGGPHVRCQVVLGGRDEGEE
ncbi:MAG: TldD/PmbA family protein [Myxococcota bacterium]